MWTAAIFLSWEGERNTMGPMPRMDRKKMGWLLLALLLLLTGCGKREEPVTGGHAPYVEDAATGKGEYIVVGFSQIGSESDWRIGSTESFRSTFTAENGYYLIYDDAQQKQENQLKAVRNFILQKVDYIIVDPIVETGWDAVLKEAKDAGIPVILADRSVKVEDEELYTCWVGSSFEQEGRSAGEWLREYLKKQGREDEEIRIVTLQGTLGSTAQIGRTEGFGKVLEQEKNWVMLDQQSGDFTQAKGQEVMEEFLKNYDRIDVVVCENDNMAFGAIEAIKKADKTCGPDGEIIILSFDAGRAALETLLDKDINAVFECNPKLGPLVSEIIRKLERGESVEKIQYVEEVYFDSTMDLEQIIEERTY